MTRSLLGFRPKPVPTIMTLVGLALLIGLGTWQLYRLQWKLNLIATIQERIHGTAVPLPPGTNIDPKAWDYRRVTVTGHFLNDKEMHLLAYTERGNLGYHLITPMIRADGKGAVLIDRGWVPAKQKDPQTRPGSEVDGTVTVVGVVRHGWSRPLFVPKNDPVKNEWFYGDLAQMAAYGGVTVPPILVELAAVPGYKGLPIAGQTQVDIPNNHLQYALTWYGLAVALLVIYILSQRRQAAEAEAAAAGRAEDKKA